MTIVGALPVLDTSAWQCPQFDSVHMTLKPGWQPPDMTKAKARGIAGVIARCSIDSRVDPFYAPTYDACRSAGIVAAAYHWIKPHLNGPAVEVAAVARATADRVPAFFMVDIEDTSMPADWKGRKLADWIHQFIAGVRQILGDVPVTLYSAGWWWNPRLGDLSSEFVQYDLVVASYPHQPATMPQTQWPPVPTDTSQWMPWAQSTQGGDPGTQQPTPPTGFPTWHGWQFSSWAMARDYGFPGAARLDCNVVKEDAWARWTKPAPKPEEPPVTVLYPVGYGKELVPMGEMRRRYEPHMEPEFARRFFPWLESKGGHIGCGGGRRTVQPTRPGFAPPGMSFHQDQRYADGTVWYTAVDLVARNPGTVHRAPRVDECPQQGSAEAKRWGVHINTSESWHIQPIENDGYQTWVNAGRKRPVPGYPIPNEGTSPSPPTHSPIPYDPQEDDVAEKILVRHVNGQMYVTDMVSYANACDEDEGERLRDFRGAKVDASTGGGPFPLDQQDSDWVARIAS